MTTLSNHLQTQQQSPATPTYILRGHASPIHALHLFANNLRLISGDAEGWVIIWDMVSKRPVVSWKAHGGAVLEAKGFEFGGNGTVVYTHGRDHKLRVWRFGMKDEGFLDKTLPVDVKEGKAAQNQPWMLHSLPVNALNFCAFDMIFLEAPHPGSDEEEDTQASPDSASQVPVLFAVPNALNSGAIDIFHLPLERRVSTIPADPTMNTGMVMAVRLLLSSSGELYAASAYEDGQVMVFVRRGRLTEQEITSNASGKGTAWKWEKLYASKPHTQPVLSIDVAPSKDCFFSSSADSVLVKHPIPNASLMCVGHAEKALKTISTKHSGQQGLRIRSDGKIFATAGWDARTRVYSCKTMKELAVLKWHKDGCYAVAFAEVLEEGCTANDSSTADAESKAWKDGDEKKTQLTKRNEGSLATVQHQRSQKAQKTHWLAAGSKDGKISLWDIY
ncbi:WD40 repeat domain-containing protein [Aspergillus chevalieri]|uniref:ASTRA-associated protein 1 n=1 Tax=Aspergillus chevalieri TaxID=182096 RepID=A0A7R7ZNH6_ASPCH|nr:ASTRA complex subunit [Aspergillus chevalieri]BCR88533.1 ASTRA complex subunit [Aspergillus chevalieri]